MFQINHFEITSALGKEVILKRISADTEDRLLGPNENVGANNNKNYIGKVGQGGFVINRVQFYSNQLYPRLEGSVVEDQLTGNRLVKVSLGENGCAFSMIVFWLAFTCFNGVIYLVDSENADQWVLVFIGFVIFLVSALRFLYRLLTSVKKEKHYLGEVLKRDKKEGINITINIKII